MGPDSMPKEDGSKMLILDSLDNLKFLRWDGEHLLRIAKENIIKWYTWDEQENKYRPVHSASVFENEFHNNSIHWIRINRR